jgi:hypothetical protein
MFEKLMLLASATEVGSLKIVDWFTNVRIITVLSFLEVWFYAMVTGYFIRKS